MIPPVRTAGPEAFPVSLDQVKLQCRIDHSDEDTLLMSFMEAAVAHLEGWSGILGRCLINQTWEAYFSTWGHRLILPFPDVSAVAVTYLDEDGAEQTLSSSLYELVHRARGSRIEFRDAFSSPALYGDTAQPVTVEMTVGYGATPENVPAAIRAAILMTVAHWFDHRDTTDVPAAVDSLIAPYRRVGL